MQTILLRVARRTRARGVTLIEVMIVIVIMGLIAGGVAVAVFPMLVKSKIDTTHINAKVLRQAAGTWRSVTSSNECPTPQRLQDERTLDSGSKLTDAWETPFKIVCRDDNEIVVMSLGPDKRVSDDDLFEPESAGRTRG